MLKCAVYFLRQIYEARTSQSVNRDIGACIGFMQKTARRDYSPPYGPLQVASQPSSNSSCLSTFKPNTFSKKVIDFFKLPIFSTCARIKLAQRGARGTGERLGGVGISDRVLERYTDYEFPRSVGITNSRKPCDDRKHTIDGYKTR